MVLMVIYVWKVNYILSSWQERVWKDLNTSISTNYFENLFYFFMKT